MSVPTPSRRIGHAAESNRRKVGRSTSSGKTRITRSIRSRMSETASSRLAPQVNLMVIELTPSAETLVISSMPVTALTPRSIGRVISSSTSSGLASSYSVVMETAGKSISGKRSTGR